MNYFQVLILSIVEGLSEFLPISSTGHLILASKLLQVTQTDFAKSFEIIIQLGAISAIVFLYWKTFLQNSNVLKKIAVAFIPTAFVGFVLYKLIKEFLIGNIEITLFALLIGGVALIVLELLYREQKHHVDSIEKMTYKTAFLIGLFQSTSVVPGVSRAAATIIGGLFLGAKRKTAIEFSFLLAVPTMIGATGLELLKNNFSFFSNELLLVVIGFLGSFIVAIFAVRFLLSFIESNTFIPFGIYRIILSIVFFLLFIA